MDLNNLFKSQWDRVAAIGLTAVGAIFLLIGWIGVSGSAYLAEQAPYIISGGVGGVFFLGVGATLWISADLRDEWRKLDRIEQALGDGTLHWADDSDSAPVGGAQELWAGSSNGSSNGSTNGSTNGSALSGNVAARKPAAKAAAVKREAAKPARARA